MATKTKSALWGIACLFNPARYGTRLINYRIFRHHLEIPLVTVELGFNGEFQLTESDAEILVQVGMGDILWQKERLLNVALQHLPPECDKVVALDADVVMANPNWVEKTGEALDSFPVVQPFDSDIELLPYQMPDSANPQRYKNRNYGLMSGLRAEKNTFGSIGRAWAFQRPILDEFGLYDTRVLGGGDTVMAFAATGNQKAAIELQKMNKAEASHYNEWALPFSHAINGQVSFIENTLLSLWHGTWQHKKYMERHHVLRTFNYDPNADIEIGPEGAWRWATPKHGFHEEVKQYFLSRHEDGKYVRSGDGRILLEVGHAEIDDYETRSDISKN